MVDFSIGTVTKTAKDPGRGIMVIQTTIQLPNPYVAGGVDITTALAAIAKAPNTTILHAHAEPIAGYYFGFVRATGKLMVYVGGTGIEAGALDLSAFTAVPVTILVN
jgi:hypothetical protein